MLYRHLYLLDLNEMAIVRYMLYIIMVLPIIILLYSCGYDLESKVLLKTLGTTMVLPYDNMVCAVDGVVIRKDSSYLSKARLIKVVIYFSETDCNSCVIKNLHLWQEVMANFNGDELDFVFIFSKTYNLQDILVESKLNLERPIYIDEYNMFRKLNSCILNSNMHNVFLLDSNNKIILLGNPIYNSDLNALYINTINNMLAHDGIFVPDEKN